MVDRSLDAFLLREEEEATVVDSFAASLESAGLHVSASRGAPPPSDPPAVLLVFVGESGSPPFDLELFLRKLHVPVVTALLPGAVPTNGALAEAPTIDFRGGVGVTAVPRLADMIRAHATPLLLSSSVEAAAKRLSGPVSAAELAAQIFTIHPEYAEGRAGRLQLTSAVDEPPKTADEWLAGVRLAFDPSAAERLHGRAVVLGLAFLSPSLRAQLQATDAFDALVSELDGPLPGVVPRDEPSSAAPRLRPGPRRPCRRTPTTRRRWTP